MSFETTPIYSWPSDEEKIWLNPYFFLHNWSSNVIVRSRWFTDISTNQNAGEIRAGLVDRPYRTITAHFTSLTKKQALYHQMMIARMGKARFWFPLYSDVSKLTIELNSNIVTTTTSQPVYIYCDTTNKRFYADKYIAIVNEDVNNKSLLPYLDIVKIISVATTYIIAEGNISRTYEVGSKVYPLLVGKLISTETHDGITDRIIDGDITVEEIIGKYSLPASATDGEITTDYSSTVSPMNLEYPILNIRPDWRDTSSGYNRVLEVNASGRGEIVETFGDKPLISGSISFTTLNRLSGFDILKLFDSRKGRLHPLYVFSNINEYSEILSISTDRKQISLEYTGPKINWAFRPYIGIRLKNGTYIVRKVIDVLTTSTTTFEPLTTTADPGIIIENICLETALPAFSLLDVLRLHVSYLCRFDTDELTENWITDTIMQCSLPFVELDEKDVEYEINYYGTTTTTSEPTTTSACEPFHSWGFVWMGSYALLQDLCLTDPEDYYNGWEIYITSGNAIGAHGTINDWGGPSYQWLNINPVDPLTEWDVNLGDTYELIMPE